MPAARKPGRAPGARGLSRRNAETALLFFLRSRLQGSVRKLAVFVSVEIVKNQADDQPNDKPNPVCNGQTRHQQQTGENREYRSNRATWCAEGTRTVWLRIAQYQHASSHESESKKRADIGKIGKCADIEQPGWDADQESGDPSGKIRREEIMPSRAPSRTMTSTLPK